MKAQTSFETDRADRYLTALCHHFGRKVEAQCGDGSGWVEFGFGRCDLTATGEHLTLVAKANNARHLRKVTKILTSHLERFAFRERPTLEWESDTTPQT